MSWPTVKLSDVCELITDGTHISPVYCETGVAMLDSKHIKDGFYIDNTSPDKFISIETDKILSNRCKPKTNDILISSRGSIGKIAIVNEGQDFNIMGNMILLRLPETICHKFLAYYIRTKVTYLISIANGVAQKGLYLNQVRSINFPLPPLAQQKRIAAILDKADEIKRKREQAIAKLDQLAQSIFMEMFGDLSNKKRWPIHSMHQLCQKITDGTHHSPAIQSDGIPYITAKHLKADGLDFFSKPWFISKQDHEQIYKRCDPKKGDVLYIKDGATTGIAAINYYEFEFSMLSSLALLRVNKNLLNAHYICYWLNSPIVKQNLLGFMAGAAIQRLTLAKIQKISVPTPPLALQEQFATRISKLEKLKASNIAALEKQNQLFASLQNQAFTGQL